jgi:hypothetical protein
MAKKTRGTRKAAAKTANKSRKKKVPTAAKTKVKAARAKKVAKRPRRSPRSALTAAAATTRVTMTIDFGAGAPGDVRSIRRIDSRALSGPGASVNAGVHTAGWDVISPTVRPIGFDVTIVEDATGRKVLDRPGQRTGADGRGAGADSFTV